VVGDPLAIPPRQRLPAGATGGALRAAVLDPRTTGEIPPRPLAAFVQALVPEIRKVEGVSAIGMAEIRDMLGLERQRQMLGCAIDEECLAEIAGALGVDDEISTDLVLVGDSYTLTMRRIDMKKAKVVQAETRRFDRRDGEELLSVVGPAVAALYPERPLKAGRTRGVDKALIRRLNPPPLPRWVIGATGGAAVAAVGGAGVFQYLVGDAKDEFDRLVTRSLGEPVAAEEFISLSDRIRSRERTRNVLLGSGVVLGVAAGVEAFFTDWRGDRAAIAPMALDGGGGVAVGGRF
jgi:hypothetical protein